MSTPRAPRIVIVDDDPSVRLLLASSFELEGFEAGAAADGPTGLELVSRMQPDCVILDVMMPGLDGHAVLRELREQHGFRLPVIMLTAAADDDHAWQAWSGGIDCFLPKPFDLEELLAQVVELSTHGQAPASDAPEPALTLTLPGSD